MSTAPAADPVFDDGDGNPPSEVVAVAAFLGEVISRLRGRGPFFRLAVDKIIRDLQQSTED